MGAIPADVDPIVWAVVVVAVLGVFPTIVAWLNRRDTRAIKNQVSNAHSSNLREELDDRHAEVLDRLSAIGSHVQRIDRRTERIGDEVVDDRNEMYRMRSDMYAAIRRGEEHRAKHDAEDHR